MIKRNLFYTFCFMTLSLYGQQDTIWTKIYDSHWNVVSVKKAHNDGYIVLANTNYVYNSDVSLFKVDNDGNIEWESVFGGEYDDQGSEVIRTVDGGYAFTGYACSYPSWGSQYTGKDIWIVKTDGLGNLEWMNNYYSSDLVDEEGFDIIQHSDGSFFVAGRRFYQGVGNYAAVLKTSSNGTQLWMETMRLEQHQDSYGDYKFSSIIEIDDGLALTGSTGSVTNDDGGGIIFFIITEYGYVLTETNIGNEYDVGNTILDNNDGSFVIGGAKWNADEQYLDAWLLNVNDNGQIQWEAQYGGDKDDEINSIIKTFDGYALAGYYGSPVWNTKKFWIISTNFNGEILWDQKIGQDSTHSIGSKIAITDDFGYMASGRINNYNATLIRYEGIAGVDVSTFSMAGSPTNSYPIPIAISFGDAVTGFTGSDIVVNGGAVSNFWGSGSEYDFDLVPEVIGTITVDVPFGSAETVSGIPNAAADQLIVIYDENPAMPENLIIKREASGSSLSLSWHQNSDGDVEKYRIYMDTTTEPVTLIDSTDSFNDTTKTILNLANGITYYFRVVAVDSFGFTSAYSAEVYDSPAELIWIDHFDDLYNWSNIGEVDWIINNDGFEGGNSVFVDCPNNSQLWANLSKNFNFDVPVSMRFYSKEHWAAYVSSVFVLDIDGTTVLNLRGDTESWIQRNANISEGEHTVSFLAKYYTEGSIDEVSIWKRYVPTPVINSTIDSITNITQIPIIITFSENVIGFTLEDIEITNSSFSSDLIGSGSEYSVDITPMDEGLITIDIPANIAEGLNGDANEEAEQYSIIYDNTPPQVSISSLENSPTNSSSINVIFTFNELIDGFNLEHINYVNCTIGDVTVSDSIYSLIINPSNDGIINISIMENFTNDLAGNGSMSSNTLEIYYDNMPPAVDIGDIGMVGTMDSVEITWIASDTSEIIKNLLFLSDDGQNFSILDSAESDVINYLWIAPNYLSDQNQIIIEVSDEWNLIGRDTSNIFSIIDNDSPMLSIFEPNENTIISEYDTLMISWEATDNIGLDSVLIYYSNNSGFTFNLVQAFNSNANHLPFIIPAGVTDTALVKVVAIDHFANQSEIISEPFIITDNTPPIVILEYPVSGAVLGIGSDCNITWSGFDNVGIEDANLFYKIGSNWEIIAENITNINFYSWIVPDVQNQTDSLQLKIIVFDGVGLSDTSYVDNLTVEIQYPKIIDITPSSNRISFNIKEIIFQMSQKLDSTTVTSQNISINSSLSESNLVELSYNDSAKSVSIHFPNGLTTSDTLRCVFSSNISNTFGYELDGDGDGDGGDSYVDTFYVNKFADFDQNNIINVDDLSLFLYGLENNLYYYELGPFTGNLPNVLVNSDQKYNIEDIVGFSMMWNYHYSNNSISFVNFSDEGIPIAINAEHDSIYLHIPNTLTAYEVQIQYQPGELIIAKVSNDDKLILTHDEQELGIYTLMAQANQSKLAIPIQIHGQEANILISYKGIKGHNDIEGKMTRNMTIENVPEHFILYPNYPNPFNPKTKIDYGLPEASNVQLKIYDILGREITTLVNEMQDPGYKTITWHGRDHMGKKVGAGMYFYLLQAGDFRQVKKMLYLK